MSYDFTTLSPSDFENLVADLLSRSWGQRLEIFKAGKDDGIDLRIAPVDTDEGDTIVQCKRYAPHKIAELLRNVKHEIPKLAKLRPRRYVLATSVGLSPHNKDAIFEQFRPWCQSTSDILGVDELNALLREHPEVEKAHFKLWVSSTQVLESLLHARIFAFTEATIDATRRQLSKLVVHNGLSRALELLHAHHHVLIAGNPGIGKTTLARMLMCHYIDHGFEPVMISSNVEDAWTLVHQVRDERQKLFIVYDDFLGMDQFDSRRFDKNEDSSLMALLDKVSASPNLRFVLTTREYILEDAKRVHGAFDERANELLKCTISLADYTETQRARMLFNHLYFSELADGRLDAFVQAGVYREIVKHRHFNPRVVEAISNAANSKAMTDGEYIKYVKEEFENPAKLWSTPFHRHISEIAKHILVCLWSFGGSAEVLMLRKCVSLMNRNVSSEVLAAQFRDAMRQIDGNFIQTGRFAASNWRLPELHIAQFHNPSVAEFVRRLVSEEPAWLERVLPAITSFDQLNVVFNAAEATKTIDETVPAFWVKLRQRLRLCEDNVHRRFLTYRYGASTPRMVWDVEPVKLSAITLRELQIEFRAQLPDEQTRILEERLLTVSAWSELIRDTLNRMIGAVDVARIQHWIATHWSMERVLESNRCYRAATFGAFNDPEYGTMELSILESLIRGCLCAGAPFNKADARAIADVAEASVSMSLDNEENPDEIRYCAKELKKLEEYINVDMSSSVAALELQANFLESKDDEEDEEDSDAEDNRYEAESSAGEDEDIDLLFSRLLSR
ncbi:nSTAND3 domain-containing NTPase [Paraburkholderia silvatlantica]|uniref:Broad-specificity NMP kinase n=1 Tax=Paraburkholderia silvatlantica TaxID=321895 RepID=A0ABR6FI58_9BURK|nr:restriction endonuclease [Paraburkholderia silvatlantica]MBB2927109.1 broad-specificity NMP kinase [Paraburkholderia silvatlantica]PVY36830.1 restriction endonuclease [Paraburkholderia silvatlantica]PXW41892.1 restriction endonuclease [Paraburkholderia silvatlantica]